LLSSRARDGYRHEVSDGRYILARTSFSQEPKAAEKAFMLQNAYMAASVIDIRGGIVS
jgi:hypothetical protein